MALDSSPIGQCGAIDADMDQNVEPLTPSRLGLAQKFKLWGAFKVVLQYLVFIYDFFMK